MKEETGMKKILLRGSWQTKNIGDIAHTPGFLSLAGKFLPDCEIWLWPCQIDLGVREMLLKNFPRLRIAESDTELKEAFETCDFLINGSGPGIDSNGIQLWKDRTRKPYGCFGISTDGLWSEHKREILSEASFIFCRDSLSEFFLKQQELACRVIAFASDATFGLHLEGDHSAATFLQENGLEDGNFICVIPRLRYTPSSFDENVFFFSSPQREAESMGQVESDMAKMREVICHIIEHNHLKVLICPEMTYQVPMGRRYLYERLPESVRKHVVLKRKYWITSEAESVYSHAKALISMEMHSPIIFINKHKPAILLRQAEDTFKGQMWRDIGLQDWILELNATDADLIIQRMEAILHDYSAAVNQASAASERAMESDRKAMEQIRMILENDSWQQIAEISGQMAGKDPRAAEVDDKKV